MRKGSILTECAAVVAIALVLGTAVHLLRTDKKQRLAFFGSYPDWGKVTPATPPAPSARSPSVPVAPPPPTQKHTQVVPDAGTVVLNAGQAPPAAADTKQDVKAPAAKPAAPAPKPSEPAGPIREVQLDEVLALQKQEEIPFFDARRTRNYDQGHLQRARNMSVWEADLDEKISELPKEFPYDMTILIYCGGGDCPDSHMLADRLKLAGYQDLRIYKGGYAEWIKKGLPVERDGKIVEGPVAEPEEGK